MSAVSKQQKAVTYYYNVYDTSTGEVICKLERTKELADYLIYSFAPDDKDPDCLYAALYKPGHICVTRINCISGDVSMVSKNKFDSGGTPKQIFLVESASKVIIDACTKGHVTSVYKVVTLNAKSSSDGNSFKTHKDDASFNFYHSAVLCGDHLLRGAAISKNQVRFHAQGAKDNITSIYSEESGSCFDDIIDLAILEDNTLATL